MWNCMPRAIEHRFFIKWGLVNSAYKVEHCYWIIIGHFHNLSGSLCVVTHVSSTTLCFFFSLSPTIFVVPPLQFGRKQVLYHKTKTVPTFFRSKMCYCVWYTIPCFATTVGWSENGNKKMCQKWCLKRLFCGDRWVSYRWRSQKISLCSQCVQKSGSNMTKILHTFKVNSP